MPIILDQVLWLYRALKDNTDPRVADWPLMGNPIWILTILGSYIYFVKVFGPNYMKDREPFVLKKTIIVYNILHVLANLWFLSTTRYSYFGGGYSWLCQPADYSTSPQAMFIVTIGWRYLMLKVSELMDTVFFVLTKKFSHISALHVIHHSLVAWSVWIGINFGATGQNAMFPLINCIIHCIMYSYYALAALGFHKYLWWKRYLTQMQMAQFIALMIHGSIPVFYDCGFPPYYGYATIFEAALFFVLFFNFYMRSYKKGPHAGDKANGVEVGKSIKVE